MQGVSSVRVLVISIAVLMACLAAVPLASFADEPGAPLADAVASITSDGIQFEDVPFSQGVPLDSERFTQMLADIEAEKAALETPAAQQEREASVDRYADLGASQATDLLQDTFGDQIATLTANPAETLFEADRVEGFRSDTAALIDPEGPGTHALYVSAVPLRSDGEIVDLGLSVEGQEISPQVPITPVEIPATVGREASLVEDRVEVSVEAPNEEASADLIPSAAGEGSDRLAFYPNTHADTDTVLAAVPGGIEAFFQLRSEASPEQLRLSHDLEAGSSMRSTADGGAEILDPTGEPSVAIAPPFAVDAQGTQVSVEMSVDGTDLVLSIPHRGTDIAYPVLVDPVYESFDWRNGAALGEFDHWTQDEAPGTAGYEFDTSCDDFAPLSCEYSNRGIFVNAPPATYFPTGSLGQWIYSVPNADVPGNDAFISSAELWSWRYGRTEQSLRLR